VRHDEFTGQMQSRARLAGRGDAERAPSPAAGASGPDSHPLDGTGVLPGKWVWGVNGI